MLIKNYYLSKYNCVNLNTRITIIIINKLCVVAVIQTNFSFYYRFLSNTSKNLKKKAFVTISS